MIRINLNLDNPRQWPSFRHLGNAHGRISNNKMWELEHYCGSTIFAFELNWTTRTDHAGFEFTVALLSYHIHANIYDRRHWNTDTNSWMTYEDSI